MNKPLVSIVIPTFDRNELVQGAILNALDQSYEHIEVIVVEDGSSSGVDVFIKDLCDDRVIYISHDTNRGLGASRNTGMSLSKGEYIAFLDDDDRWMKDKIRLQVDVMWKSSNKMMMVYCISVKKSFVTF